MKKHHDGPHPEHTFHLESPAKGIVNPRHVVVGIGSEPSGGDVLDFALSLATAEDASLHVVHCIDAEDQPVETDSPRFEKRLNSAMITQRERALSALTSHPGKWTYDCKHDDPADLIVSTAEKYDAFTIVIGAPRRGPISAMSQLLHSSVASRLDRQNRYPIVMVPAGVKSRTWTHKST
ncbi:universal stress protein [Rhodococcus sp. WS3]|uniref:universal stress protein n=1 Tax=Rhodococcus sp. WS3 TaxID=2486271 RepID=UPI001143BF6F|nr:universal stress protein [Rhodococcus sp. WS3]ROZ48572.1 universal stress protein [Rhodococcus sp. WS3]